MKRFRLHTLVWLLPVLLLALAGVGCPSKDKDGTSDADKASKDGDGKAEPLKALDIPNRGTLRGKVVYEGTLPRPEQAGDDEDIRKKMKDKDATNCLHLKATDEEKTAFEWRIDPTTKGVANVFVWVQPPRGHYFKLSDEDKKIEEKEKVIDQPHCAFMPHALVFFPSFYDGKTQKPTGQKLTVKNSATIPHNTNYKGVISPGGNLNLPPGDSQEIKLRPEPNPVRFICDIHTWMKAYVRVFDHPFATVTGKDGTYEIKNVPIGVPLRIVAWHEKREFLKGGAQGEEVTLKDGEERDFTITSK